MQKFLENKTADPDMVRDSKTVYEATGGKLEVKANKAWNRVSIRPRESIYFVRRADGQFAIHLGGGNVDKFGDRAIYVWGRPKRIYHGPNGEHEWLWRMQPDEFSSSILTVFGIEEAQESDAQLVKEIDQILQSETLFDYEKKAMAKERIGHSRFAREVKRAFDYRCAVVPSLTRNLIAAHIKPWASCEGSEKIDTHNGIAFSPNIDGLFEDGIISFDSSGKILISDELTTIEREAYGISGQETISFSGGQDAYLEWHRKNKLQD